ncbi:MAG: BatD family protein [Victivallaceae bacterium]|nr:BatD family protein [Victivallaceae bacterium]
MFKRICAISFCLISFYVSGADMNLRIGVSTKRPLVGEVVTISITADESPKLTSLPEIENATWLPNYSSTSMSSVNGNARYTRTYAFRVDNQGTVTIPELEVEAGGKINKINSFKLEAVSAGDQRVENDEGGDVAIKDIIFGKVEILNLNQNEFYVGEEISLEISLFSWQQVRVQPTEYPAIRLDKIVFRDYSQQNQQNPRFIIKRESLVTLKGKKFIKQSFETAFRALAPGDFKTDIKIPTEMRLPTEQRDFFGRPTFKSTPYTVEIPFEVKVKALPPVPENSNFLGLVGNWDVNFSLKDKKIKVGEPLTLSMTVYGLGTLETLNVPSLEIEGFRVYPPEIDKKTAYDGRERAEIKYVIIPLQKGEKELKLSVSVFSSLLKKYKSFDFSKTLDVAKSDTPGENINYPASPPPSIPAPEFKAKQEVPRLNILFLKTEPAGEVSVPLYLNWLWAYIVFGICGPLCWLVSEASFRRQQKLGSNKALQRRLTALKRKGKVLKAIRKSSDDDLNTAIQHEAVPFINDMLNLPPGTTTSELAARIKDAELAQCLTSVGEASYLPGASNLDQKELRNKLCKALKHLAVAMLVFIMPLALDAAEKPEKIIEKAVEAVKPEKTVPETFAEAVAAYDSGDFDLAAEFFRVAISKDSPDPALLYNLGTCLCGEGDFAGALVCFERAHLLAPYDTAITENLNFVRRRLFLPEIDKIESPTDMLIAASYALRPDEWLLLAVFAWALAGVFLAFRRKLTLNKRIIFVGSCLIIFAAALSACIYEQLGAYSNANAVVTSPDAELRSLPSSSSGSKLVRLRMGTVVRIIEPRFDWLRIKSESAKGWLHKSKITRIAPGNELPPAKETGKSIVLKKNSTGKLK